MNKEQYELFTKVHNELLKRLRLNPSKYQRQDSFSAIIDVKNGKPMKDALIETFKAVYNVEISDLIYHSCYNLCVGLR
jgi:hypothetical protein